MAKTYVLKIYRPGTKVYRTALVPGWATLDELHQKIHEWMEFPTYEMYGFFPNNKLLSESGLYAPQMQNRRSAADVRVEDLHLRKDQRILYVYDLQQLLQFYIHVEDVEDRPVEEIRLLRRNGHLNLGRVDVPEDLPDDPDAWHVEADDITMFDCIVSAEYLELVDLVGCINADVDFGHDPGPEELAEVILNALQQDDSLALRLMPLYLMQALRQISDTPNGAVLTLPYEFLVRLGLLGFVFLQENETDRFLVVSQEAKDWFQTVLDKSENLRLIEMYARWNAAARGILCSYGVLQMDTFLQFFNQYTIEQPDVDQICDFMMQRMEWNEECYAIEDGTDVYWSLPEPERADRILKKLAQTEGPYKKFSQREIYDNAETAGWQHVTCSQDLFQALQGMAMEPDQIREALHNIVTGFTKGLEPYEIMEAYLPPASQIGRPAYGKVRMLLRQIRRQLPDYSLKGYTIEEKEKMDPSFKSIEGITVLKGGR